MLTAIDEWTMLAVERYYYSKAAFYPFWKQLVKRRITNTFDYYKAKGRKSGIPTLHYDGKDEWILNDSDIAEASLIEKSIYKDNINYLYQLIDELLEGERRDTLLLWMNGVKYDDISKRLNIKRANVNYLISSAIKILRNNIDEHRFK